jgi:hypothetical protein
MNIQAEKIEIVKMILETDNEFLLKSVRSIIEQEQKSDFWNALNSDQKEDIELGLREIEKGETVDYEELMKNN